MPGLHQDRNASHASLALALALACALAPLSAWGRGNGARLPEGMSQFIETRYTHPSLDGDSRPDVERTFDELGTMVRAIYTTVTPDGTEQEILTVDAGGRTRTLESMRRGRLVRREVETFAGREILIQRETWREGADGAVETKTVETFLGFDVMVEEFVRTRDGWEKTGSSRRSGLHIRRDPPAPFDVTSESRLYAECLRERANPTDPDALIDPYYTGNVNVATCSRQLTDLINERGFDYERYANLRCTSSTEFFLPNGFRIDRESCFGIPPDVRGSGNARGWTHDVLNLAARKVTEQNDGMLACLNTVNAPLARKVARALAEKRPRLQCRGNADLDAMDAAVCGEPAEASCRNRLNPLMEHSGAFYTESRPHDIFLTNHDPSKTIPPEVERDGDGELPPNEEVRLRYQGQLDTQGTQVASTLFHELLHAAGLHGSDHHNDAEGDPTDAVYGCQAICGGANDDLTREGCLACLGAEGNRPTRANRGACNTLPRKATIEAARGVRDISRNLFRCLALKTEAMRERDTDQPGDRSERLREALASEACTGLENSAGYPSACRGQYPWYPPCERSIRVLIGQKIREASAAASPNELADGLMVADGSFHGMIQSGNLAFPAISIGGGAGGVSTRRFLNLAVSHAFCAEAALSVEGGTRRAWNATLARSLRTEYDRSVPSLSRADRAELVTFEFDDGTTVTQPVWRRSGYGGNDAYDENFAQFCSQVEGGSGRELYGNSFLGAANIIPQ